MTWGAEQLDRIGRAPELTITTARGDGSLPRPVPVWVVRVDDAVYVRTWYARDTGWYGRATAAGRARIRVDGYEGEVGVRRVGADSTSLRSRIDTAYRDKYGGSGGMTSHAAAASTLRLDCAPETADPSPVRPA